MSDILARMKAKKDAIKRAPKLKAELKAEMRKRNARKLEAELRAEIQKRKSKRKSALVLYNPKMSKSRSKRTSKRTSKRATTPAYKDTRLVVYKPPPKNTGLVVYKPTPKDNRVIVYEPPKRKSKRQYNIRPITYDDNFKMRKKRKSKRTSKRSSKTGLHYPKSKRTSKRKSSKRKSSKRPSKKLTRADANRIRAFARGVYKTRGEYKDLAAIYDIGLKELKDKTAKFNKAASVEGKRGYRSQQYYRREIKAIIPALERVKQRMLAARKNRIQALYGKSRVTKKGTYARLPKKRFSLGRGIPVKPRKERPTSKRSQMPIYIIPKSKR